MSYINYISIKKVTVILKIQVERDLISHGKYEKNLRNDLKKKMSCIFVELNLSVRGRGKVKICVQVIPWVKRQTINIAKGLVKKIPHHTEYKSE